MIYIGMINYNKHFRRILLIQLASELNVHKNFKTASLPCKALAYY